MLTDDIKIFLGCAYRVANYYDSTTFYSTEVACSADGDPMIPPLPAYDGSYILDT